MTEAIGKILRSTDPIEALSIFEDSIKPYISHRGWGDNLCFEMEIFDEDFIGAAKNHKERLAKLRELSIENNYFQLIKEFEESALEWIIETKAWESTSAIKVSAHYNKSNLKKIAFTFESTDQEARDPIIISSELGSHVFIIESLSLQINSFKQSKCILTDPADIIKTKSWHVRRPFQKEVDTHLLGEEFVSPWM